MLKIKKIDLFFRKKKLKIIHINIDQLNNKFKSYKKVKQKKYKNKIRKF